MSNHPTDSHLHLGNADAHAPGMPVVAVIGDGQLARMMHTEAIELGQSIRLLAGARDASAAQVAADVVIGDYLDLDALRTAAAGACVVTFDHEHVPTEHLHQLLAEGVNVQPGPDALVNAQDKLLMRQRLADIGAPVPAFCAVDSREDALAFWDQVAGQVCLKARRGGYDGKGVWFPGSRKELMQLVDALLIQHVPLMAEQKMPLVRELSALVARTPSGVMQHWPVAQSVQRDGICVEAIAPAPECVFAEQAGALACHIAESLGVTGVMAVELFETADGIWVNELAMRPHNTGHWTQNGCVTSQFEQHLRAILDKPLGSTRCLGEHTVMANILGGEEDPELPMADRVQHVWARFPDAKVHLYGKGWRPGRKIGHINICSDEPLDELRRRAELAAHYLVHAVWADGYPAGKDNECR
ncbi:MAG: 5-(carboxyamino)imidazole ribonucleotide synthase [Corynebacterium sp.]|nr:5-(carboxyamino)imidazole ribonucleotide synthase [Corynebacterium sp.]